MKEFMITYNGIKFPVTVFEDGSRSVDLLWDSTLLLEEDDLCNSIRHEVCDLLGLSYKKMLQIED